MTTVAASRTLATLAREETAPTVDSSGAILRRAANEIVHQLAVLVRLYRIHSPDNDAFHSPAGRLERQISQAMALETSLRLECVDTDFFANGLRVRASVKSLPLFRDLASVLGRHRVGGLAFHQPPDHAATMQLLGVLVGAEPCVDLGEFRMRLGRSGVQGIDALPLAESAPGAPDDVRRRAVRAYEEALDLIREYMHVVDSPARLSGRRAKRVVHKLVDLSYEDGDGFSLAGLAAIRSHDEYTLNHMVNVCVIAITFGQRLGLRRSQLARLGLCAFYHDMGKLHVPCDVLNRCGPLSDEEWAQMGNHTVYAARTLFPLVASDLDTMPRIITALQHHLRHDGTGYPKLRVLRQQSLYTRITSVVDAYDAMTTMRVYSRARLPQDALREVIAGAGTQFDPFLARAFVSCMGVYPIGSAVALSNGDLAVVCECGPDPEQLDRPTVVLVTRDGRRVGERVVVDLSRSGAEGLQITGCVDPERYDINCAYYLVGSGDVSPDSSPSTDSA